MKSFSLEQLQLKSTENVHREKANEVYKLNGLKRTSEWPQNLVSFKKQRPISPTINNISDRLIETYNEVRDPCFKSKKTTDSNNNSSYSNYLTGIAQFKNKSFRLKDLFESDEEDNLLNGKIQKIEANKRNL